MTHRTAVCTTSGALHGVCLFAICSAVARDIAFGVACGAIAGLYFGVLALLHTRMKMKPPGPRPLHVEIKNDPRGPVVTTVHASAAIGKPIVHLDVRRMPAKATD